MLFASLDEGRLAPLGVCLSIGLQSVHMNELPLRWRLTWLAGHWKSGTAIGQLAARPLVSLQPNVGHLQTVEGEKTPPHFPLVT